MLASGSALRCAAAHRTGAGSGASPPARVRGGTLDRVAAQRARHVQPLRADRRPGRRRRADAPHAGARSCASIAPPARSSPGWPKDGPRLADGRTFTLTLRDGVAFSDGVPFTSADVVFSFRALYDPAVESVARLRRDGPGQAAAGHARPTRARSSSRCRRRSRPASRCSTTSRSTRSTSSQPALDAHTFATPGAVTTPPGTMAGLGPFVLAEHVPGQRMTFTRNPHYWQKDAAGVALPYLDRIVDGDRADPGRRGPAAAGGRARPDDHGGRPPGGLSRRCGARASRARCSSPTPASASIRTCCGSTSRRPPGRAKAGRICSARSSARRSRTPSIATRSSTRVYLGAAVPVYGPVTPGNRTWYSDARADVPARSGARAGAARRRSASPIATATACSTMRAGRPGALLDPDAGAATSASGPPTVIQEQLRQVGHRASTSSALDPPSIFGALRRRATTTASTSACRRARIDPAMNLDFWLSCRHQPLLEPDQASPATPWEKRIDDLMQRQVAAPTLAGAPARCSPKCSGCSARTCRRSISSRRRSRSR